MHEPELLKRLAAEEAQAAGRAPEKEHLHVGGRGAARVLRGIRGGEPRAVPQDEGQQHEGAKEHARRREGEGTDVVHPDRLRDEAQAPDRGRDEEKNGLAKLKERHDGSVLLGMLFFFRAESAHSIRGPDARRGHDPAPETPARGRIRAPYPTVLRSVIPSFSSLLLSVLGCMPALSAAPPAPLTRPPVRSRSALK